ncbi:hypothetical protein RZN25_17885 [Bacillaceae bacterium S4-13-56]
MNKVEVIARRVLGWKLNSVNKWFDYEKGIFIENFQPEENMEHALMIVERLKELGFSYSQKSDSEVCFDRSCATGKSLAEAITNAAFELADNRAIDDEWL